MVSPSPYKYYLKLAIRHRCCYYWSPTFAFKFKATMRKLSNLNLGSNMEFWLKEKLKSQCIVHLQNSADPWWLLGLEFTDWAGQNIMAYNLVFIIDIIIGIGLMFWLHSRLSLACLYHNIILNYWNFIAKMYSYVLWLHLLDAIIIKLWTKFWCNSGWI